MLQEPNEINIAVVLKIPQALKTDQHHSKHNMHVGTKALKSPCSIACIVVSSAEQFFPGKLRRKKTIHKRTNHIFQDLVINLLFRTNTARIKCCRNLARRETGKE